MIVFCHQRRQQGVALMALLVVITVMGVLLTGAGEVWQTVGRREREKELLFIGMQYRNAILSYRDRSPNGTKEYPRSFEDLLQDRRFPYPVRHLRHIYRDPITNSLQWGQLMAGDRIIGVYSLSEQIPFKQDNFPPGLEVFSGRQSYREWIFAGS